jgi:hypothetical protein
MAPAAGPATMDAAVTVDASGDNGWPLDTGLRPPANSDSCENDKRSVKLSCHAK